MGSKARIVLYAPSEGVAADAAREAFDEMDRLNLVMSDYNERSEAMRLSAKGPGQPHAVSADLLDVLLKSRLVHAGSGGAFDPCLGALTSLWRASFRAGRLPAPQRLADARARSGLRLITMDPESSTVLVRAEGVRLDFGGIGKGYAADRALGVLRKRGLGQALVDLGGDLAVGDPPPDEPGWRVGRPGGDGGASPLQLSNIGVATSGSTYRSITVDGVVYSHILDPRTGYGLQDVRPVTVHAQSAWLADALASAASVLGPEGDSRIYERWPDVEIIWHE